MNINLTADVKVQPQATDQNTIILVNTTSESDMNIAQYTPLESSTTSDVEVRYFTFETTSNTSSEPHNDSSIPSNEESKRVQKQTYKTDFV